MKQASKQLVKSFTEAALANGDKVRKHTDGRVLLVGRQPLQVLAQYQDELGNLVVLTVQGNVGQYFPEEVASLLPVRVK